MIKIENVEVVGWEHAIRGMRNPKNSWEKSDSFMWDTDSELEKAWGLEETVREDAFNMSYHIGPNDHNLMMRLAKGGPVHAKYRRMITVYLDITAPLYWWKEFDTYKVGTVANSCSTMHKIHDRQLILSDFSYDKLIADEEFCWANGIMTGPEMRSTPLDILSHVIEAINVYRDMYVETGDKRYWEQMIQLLPSSYNQKRTIMLNYEVLVGMYKSRKNHKLDEWREFCKWIESLPYSELITGKVEEKKNG